MKCLKVNGKPFRIPDPAPLPKARVQVIAPFRVTGVDFTGALYIHSSKGEETAYICLFTCAVIRGIHLEVVTDLTEETFMQAFRRYLLAGNLFPGR